MKPMRVIYVISPKEKCLRHCSIEGQSAFSGSRFPRSVWPHIAIGGPSVYFERHTRVRFLLAFWLFVLSGVAFLDRTNISIAGIQISKEYGLGNQRLGWIFSAFLIGYAGFQIPAGWLAARYGPRRVLTLGVLWG